MKWKNLNTNYSSQLEKIKKQSPYERLGINSSASLEEIKKAYRQKVLLYHPDKTDVFMSKFSEEVIKLLNEAMAEIRGK
jgi:curved DNA-binding protein CbpA